MKKRNINMSVWLVVCSFLIIAGFNEMMSTSDGSSFDNFHDGAKHAIENDLDYSAEVYFKSENGNERGAGKPISGTGNFNSRMAKESVFDLHDVSKKGISVVRIELNADSVKKAYSNYKRYPRFINGDDGFKPKTQFGVYESRRNSDIYSIYLIFHRTEAQTRETHQEFIDYEREKNNERFRNHVHGHICKPSDPACKD